MTRTEELENMVAKRSNGGDVVIRITDPETGNYVEGPMYLSEVSEDWQSIGLPREQYKRTYVLLPPGAGNEWVRALVDETWDAEHWTFGGSADDAGIGALEDKTVIAINPHLWPSDLEQFFEAFYPDTQYVAIAARDTVELRSKLKELTMG